VIARFYWMRNHAATEGGLIEFRLMPEKDYRASAGTAFFVTVQSHFDID
jgi:hypothetical protein